MLCAMELANTKTYIKDGLHATGTEEFKVSGSSYRSRKSNMYVAQEISLHLYKVHHRSQQYGNNLSFFTRRRLSDSKLCWRKRDATIFDNSWCLRSSLAPQKNWMKYTPNLNFECRYFPNTSIILYLQIYCKADSWSTAWNGNYLFLYSLKYWRYWEMF